jgi:hypothetical protein
MAAFCACCGAEIKLKAEACVVCGTPRHGMLPQERKPALDTGDQPAENESAGKQRRPRL